MSGQVGKRTSTWSSTANSEKKKITRKLQKKIPGSFKSLENAFFSEIYKFDVKELIKVKIPFYVGFT